jgi:hypothetical protein
MLNGKPKRLDLLTLKSELRSSFNLLACYTVSRFLIVSVTQGSREVPGHLTRYNKQSFNEAVSVPWGFHPHPNPMRGLFSCFPLFSRGGGRKRRAEEAVNRCRTRDAGVPKADGGRVTDVTSRVEIGDIPSVFGRAAGRADRLRVRRPRRHFPAKSAAGAIGNPGLVMQQTPRRR